MLLKHCGEKKNTVKILSVQLSAVQSESFVGKISSKWQEEGAGGVQA